MNRFATLFSAALAIFAGVEIASALTTPANVGPVVTNPMSNYDQYIDSTRAIDLSAFFADPDSTAAATLTTPLGAITITLDGMHAPATVANFLNYVNTNRYFTVDAASNGALASTFFHRSVSNFVIQAGGFIGTTNTNGNGNAQPIVVGTFPAVQNEPFISNIRGTVAMAKLSGDPNSATSQWFISLADNSANLDTQNGGFTVFGHVTGSGMSVADAIAALPTAFGAPSPFDSLPVRDYTQGTPVRVPNLVSIPEFRTASPLSYTASSNNESVATVSASDKNLLVATHQVGSAQITVNGFDLDGAGPVSQTFTVNVIAAPGRLRNIATRVSFPVGNEVQIPGFIMRGGSSKRLVVRAIGPSLSVPNPISDPVLELRDVNQTLIASNDNWVDSTDKLLLSALNLAPTSDKESALIVSVPSNASNANYTAIMQNRGNAPGVGLVEVYDLDTAPGATLLNVSTRGEVGTGDNVLIGGLITGGAESRRLVVRAIGPSLTQAGVPGALPDPTLEVRNGQGTLLASNDDWQTQTNPNDVAEISSRGFALSDSHESAVILTVPSGGYTAVVAGTGSTPTGVGLVEVYQVE